MLDTPKRDTVGDSAYRTIRDDIIFGRLKPNERLRLESLRRRYGVSVTTLREMLNRLASEGLVITEGQKGFEVASVSDANLREVAELRLLVEGHAIARSFENGDLDWEAQVVAAHHKLFRLEGRMIAGDMSVKEGWKKADWSFHQALIAACHSKTLLDLHGQIFDKYQRYQMLTLAFRGKQAAAEHRELLDCVLRRDTASAQDLLKKHILSGVEYIINSRSNR
jgi:DNA-binding GntR family transcriptional regulator